MNKLVILAMLTLAFTSCLPEPQYKFKSQHQTVGPDWYPIIKACCYGEGTDCSVVGVIYFRSNTTLQQYVQNDNLAGYFQNENWESLFGPLDPELVSQIIATNPKLAELADGNYVVLKDKSKPLSSDNVVYTFVAKAEPCDHFPEN